MRTSEGKEKEMEIAVYCACSVVWRVLVEEELLQSARLITVSGCVLCVSSDSFVGQAKTN